MSSKRRIGAGTHVQSLGGEPDDVDADHCLRLRMQLCLRSCIQERWLGKDHVVEVKLPANSSEAVALLLTPDWLNAEAVGDFSTDMVDQPLD